MSINDIINTNVYHYDIHSYFLQITELFLDNFSYSVLIKMWKKLFSCFSKSKSDEEKQGKKIKIVEIEIRLFVSC